MRISRICTKTAWTNIFTKKKINTKLHSRQFIKYLCAVRDFSAQKNLIKDKSAPASHLALRALRQPPVSYQNPTWTAPLARLAGRASEEFLLLLGPKSRRRPAPYQRLTAPDTGVWRSYARPRQLERCIGEVFIGFFRITREIPPGSAPGRPLSKA